MPYVIKTTTDSPPLGSRNRTFVILTRRAVVTLDEARECAAEAVNRICTAIAGPGWPKPNGVAEDAHRNRRHLICHAYEIPEAGDEIALPDGTVIEVQRVDWPRLAGGIDGGAYMPEAEIIAAFNAAQEDSR